MRLLATRDDGSVVSPNWSGYAVTGNAGTITAITGSWIVPDAICGAGAPRSTGASHWIGIDGYTSSTVEQTGTDADCSSGKPRYYAWYEFYPNPGTTIAKMNVQAGDVMTASVQYSDSKFIIIISDQRTGVSFSKTKAVAGAKRNSAEWIAEDNSTNFTDFGTAWFGQDQTGVLTTCGATSTTAGTQPIGSFPAASVHAITMADSKGTTMALPGPLSADQTSFSVQWQAVR